MTFWGARRRRRHQPSLHHTRRSRFTSFSIFSSFQYHCELNPIERCWADLKKFIRSHTSIEASGSGKLARVRELTEQFFDLKETQEKNLSSHFKFAQDNEQWFRDFDGSQTQRVGQIVIDLNEDSDCSDDDLGEGNDLNDSYSDSDYSVEF